MPSKFGEMLSEFAGETTAHGLGRVSSSKAIWLKLFWAIAFLASTCILIWQLVGLVQYYYSRPVTVKTKGIYEQVTFPAVSFCNLNPIKNSQLSLGGQTLVDTINKYTQAVTNQMSGGKVTGDQTSAINGNFTLERKKRDIMEKPAIYSQQQPIDDIVVMFDNGKHQQFENTRSFNRDDVYGKRHAKSIIKQRLNGDLVNNRLKTNGGNTNIKMIHNQYQISDVEKSNTLLLDQPLERTRKAELGINKKRLNKQVSHLNANNSFSHFDSVFGDDYEQEISIKNNNLRTDYGKQKNKGLLNHLVSHIVLKRHKRQVNVSTTANPINKTTGVTTAAEANITTLETIQSNSTTSPTTSTVGNSNTTASPTTSTVGNSNTTASPTTSTVGHSNTTASLKTSTVGNSNTTASPTTSTVGNSNTTASPTTSTVGNSNTTASPTTSTVGNSNTTASPTTSTVGNSNTTASPTTSTVGNSNTTLAPTTSTVDQSSAAPTASTVDQSNTTAESTATVDQTNANAESPTSTVDQSTITSVHSITTTGQTTSTVAQSNTTAKPTTYTVVQAITTTESTYNVAPMTVTATHSYSSTELAVSTVATSNTITELPTSTAEQSITTTETTTSTVVQLNNTTDLTTPTVVQLNTTKPTTSTVAHTNISSEPPTSDASQSTTTTEPLTSRGNQSNISTALKQSTTGSDVTTTYDQSIVTIDNSTIATVPSLDVTTDQLTSTGNKFSTTTSYQSPTGKTAITTNNQLFTNKTTEDTTIYQSSTDKTTATTTQTDKPIETTTINLSTTPTSSSDTPALGFSFDVADEYYRPDINISEMPWFANTQGSSSAQAENTVILTNVLSSTPIETRRQMGNQIQDMLQECTWNGVICTPLNFTTFYDKTYGNCFTFNSGYDDTPILKAEKSGALYGLAMTLFIDQNEYIDTLAPAAGVRILIHRHDEQPFPVDNGFTAIPGQKTSFQLIHRKFEHLSYPYGQCTYTGVTNEHLLYSKSYSQLACQKSCFQNRTIKICGCANPELTIPGQNSICNSTDMECLDNIILKGNKGKLECDCPKHCHENVYFPAVSSSTWPGEKFILKIQSLFSERGPTMEAAVENITTISNNFLRIEVFYNELKFDEIVESPAYLVKNLLSDIGGQLGLWIGFSVLTIVEIGQLAFDLMTFCFRKKHHNEVHSDTNLHDVDVDSNGTKTNGTVTPSDTYICHK